MNDKVKEKPQKNHSHRFPESEKERKTLLKFVESSAKK